MLKLKKYAGVKIISYSIIILSLMMLLGIPIILIFAKSHNLELQIFGFYFGFSIFIAVIGFVSAIGYLKKKKWGRISLISTCVLYLVLFGYGSITVYRFNGSVSWTSIVIVCICIYGIWYLLQPESKDWVLMETQRDIVKTIK
jgi:hypothetical protein